jgi:hypothetical protein
LIICQKLLKARQRRSAKKCHGVGVCTCQS